MARNEVVPIGEIRRRAPEAGRIRLGIKTKTKDGKHDRPTSIKTFRFTSVHRDLIELLAEQHGGRVEPWNEPTARAANQWQVTSEVNQIRVYLPQDGLSQSYELWKAGGCERRCDGETVELIRMENDSAVPYSVACICSARGERECKPKTRIQVFIPNIPFMGSWRLETGSWAALHELPGMFEITAALQKATLVDAILGVEARTDKVGGKTRHYVVPTLGVAMSPLEIQAGMANVTAIESGTHPSNPDRTLSERPTLELVERNGHGPDHTEPEPEPNDDVIEGEVVEDAELRWTQHLRVVLAKFVEVDNDRVIDAIFKMTRGDEAKISKIHADLRDGRVEPVGFTARGTIQWKENLDG